MTFGIVGLGLIGGSFAKAIKANLGDKVLGFDINKDVINTAKQEKVIDENLSSENLKECDVIFIALYPNETVEYIKKQRSYFKNCALIIDLCGVKTAVMQPLERVVKESNFTLVGGHPMAGTENSGYKFSKPTLFSGASMILTPYNDTKSDIINGVKPLFKALGFEKVVITNCETHDEIIAFTSQLAHVVSNAFMKSETALKHHGFSAGSYKDLTRVAKLNEEMWSQLFLSNKKPLLQEIDSLITELKKYKIAIETEDKTTLKQLLKDGRERKEKVDNIWKL